TLAGCLASTALANTASFAQSLNDLPLTKEDKARYSELLFKRDKTAQEVAEWRQLHERMKASMKPDDTTQYVSTEQLNRPYVEAAPDIGITRLKAGVNYHDTYSGFNSSENTTSADASGTSARVGLDVRVNVPIQGGLELFAGGWSFGNIGGDSGLHSEETIHLQTGSVGAGFHNLALTYAVNNILTGYAGIGIPIYYSYCDCFLGPKQVMLSPYAGVRVGQIKLDSRYVSGAGTGSASDSETYVSPVLGLELKAKSGKIGHTGLQLNAAIGYQYQFGADANLTTSDGAGQDAVVNFDIDSQQHGYMSLRLVHSF
ncbi:MAG: autotransporter domain-containing protein, partial [Hyphomicrobiales bacterium]